MTRGALVPIWPLGQLGVLGDASQRSFDCWHAQISLAPLSCTSHDDDAHDMIVMHMAIIAIWDPILMVLVFLGRLGKFPGDFAPKTCQ